MKKHRLGLIIPTFLPIIATVACTEEAKNQKLNANDWWDRDITITVNPGWSWSDKPRQFEKAAQILAKKINELKNGESVDKYSYKGLGDVKVTFDYSTLENDARMQSVVSKKHDLAFASITSTNNADQTKIRPYIQTLTNSFVFDKTLTRYAPNEDDPLVHLKRITDAQNTAYSSKYNENNDTWNEKVYTNFYDTNVKVDFYRGLVWIYGPNKEKAKAAWSQKNWANFVATGIVHGGIKSGGKFMAQEALFKKHFGEDAFTTLAEEIQKKPDKFKKGGAKDMGKPELSKYSVVLGYEGAFAWTKKVNKDQSKNFDSPNAEILMVTEPLKYDIGSFRKNMDPRQMKIIALAFEKMVEDAESKSDSNEKEKALFEIYGPSYGYNGYRIIQDRLAEVETLYKEVMGIN